MKNMKKKKQMVQHVICECGYYNQPENVSFFGTCTRCRKVLDPKAKFRYDMYKKLRLWKGKRWD